MCIIGYVFCLPSNLRKVNEIFAGVAAASFMRALNYI